jgi:hypothetical protein
MNARPNPPPHPLADELPRWTLERMDLFIRALRRTRNVAAAARAAGMSRQAAYKLRARLRALSPGHPFDRAWAAALAPREAFRRMTSGYAPAEAGRITTGDAGLQVATQGDRG